MLSLTKPRGPPKNHDEIPACASSEPQRLPLLRTRRGLATVFVRSVAKNHLKPLGNYKSAPEAKKMRVQGWQWYPKSNIGPTISHKKKTAGNHKSKQERTKDALKVTLHPQGT